MRSIYPDLLTIKYNLPAFSQLPKFTQQRVLGAWIDDITKLMDKKGKGTGKALATELKELIVERWDSDKDFVIKVCEESIEKYLNRE